MKTTHTIMFGVKDVSKMESIKIKIMFSRPLRLRMSLGIALIKLGAWLTACTKVETVNEEQ